MVELLRRIDQFLELYCDPNRCHTAARFEEPIRAWRHRLLPVTLHGRLRTTVRRSFHDISRQYADDGETLFSDLARELLDDSAALSTEIPWLFTTDATASYTLGVHLGRLDRRGELLERFATAATEQPNTGLLRGYVVGLLDRNPGCAPSVCDLLDRLASGQPRLTFDLLATGFPSLCPVERAFRLVDAGGISPATLGVVWRLVGGRPLTEVEFSGVLTRLLPPMRAGDAAAGRAAIDVLSMQLHSVQRERREGTVFPEQQTTLVQTVLETSLPLDFGGEGGAWVEVLTELGRSDPRSAIRLGLRAFVSENRLWLSDSTERFLIEAAQRQPQMVMDELGTALLTPGSGHRLYQVSPVIVALPFTITRSWIDRNGLEASRALARLLPPPELCDGVPIVPELTEFVLERFGHDEEVFTDFCAGSSSHACRMGDIAAQYDQDATVARHFRLHRCRWIRAWALDAERSARENAAWFRVRVEEIESP